MKYSKESKPIGLGEKFKFGIEIEAFNVNTSRNIINSINNIPKTLLGKYFGNLREHKSLYHSKESNRFFSEILSSTGKKFYRVPGAEEQLVNEGGCEIVSPILYDTEKDWESLAKICEHIKKYPGKKGDEVIADEKCGLHVHFDANELTKSPEIMKTFLTLWPHMEEIIYKICNDVNSPIRSSTLNRSKNPFHLFQKMAAPTGKKILKQIEKGELKVSYKKQNFVQAKVISYLKTDTNRYKGLNLANIGNPNKNTVEFRMSNGTLDPEVIKQNVFLYSAIIKNAQKLVENKEYKEAELAEFLKSEITEEQKVEAFTNLIFDNTEDKEIYKKRWESNHNQEIYEKHKKDFAPNMFKREELKAIANRPRKGKVHECIDYISNKIRYMGERSQNERN